MSHIISGRWFGSLAVLVAVSFPAFSEEKNAKPNSTAVAAAQQVKEALRAEAVGNNDRRAELLSDAFRFASDLPEANWNLSRVQVGGNWMNIEEAEEQAANDPKIAEYRKLRDEAGENPKLIRKLARWCLNNGLQDTAKLHYAQLFSRNDIDADTRQEAIQRLDLRFVGGTWMSGEAVKAEEERGRAIEAAMHRWRPRLKQLQLTIDNGDFAAREKASRELQGIDDPQTIIVLESFQLDGGDRFCEEAVKRLAQFPQIEATHALARFAVMSSFVGVRDAAIKALKDRTKYDYVPLLMSGLVGPIQSQFAVGVDRSGTVHYMRTTVREDAQSRRVLVENRPTTIGLPAPRTQRVLPVLSRAMRAQGVSVALNRVAWDVQERGTMHITSSSRISTRISWVSNVCWFTTTSFAIPRGR